MDFCKVHGKMVKKSLMEVKPDFVVGYGDDLMVRGKAFYAIWNPDSGMWSQNEFDVATLVDRDIDEYVQSIPPMDDVRMDIRWMSSYNGSSWKTYKSYLSQMPDCYHQLDDHLMHQSASHILSSLATIPHGMRLSERYILLGSGKRLNGLLVLSSLEIAGIFRSFLFSMAMLEQVSPQF